MYLDSIGTVHAVDSSWYTVVQLDADNVKMKLDTGATINTLPLRVYRKLTNKRKITKSDKTLYGYGKKLFENLGFVTLRCQVGKKIGFYKFHVVDDECPPLLGVKASEELGLVLRGKEVHALTSPITNVSLIQEYIELFTGLGCFSKPYDAQIEPGAKPFIHPLRRVPISLQEKLKKKLDEMESEGVISKMDEPTDRVSSLVTVEKKNGSLRVYLNPRDLNLVIKREHFMIPTAQVVISQLGGKTIFIVLDQKDSYWQVPLTPETAKLLGGTVSRECRLVSAAQVKSCRRGITESSGTYQVFILSRTI